MEDTLLKVADEDGDFFLVEVQNENSIVYISDYADNSTILAFNAKEWASIVKFVEGQLKPKK